MKKSVSRIIGLVMVIALFIFGAVNAIWYFGYQRTYDKISEHLEMTYMDDIQDIEALRFCKDIGEYSIRMKMPTYLGSGGFISVGKTEGYIVHLDENGDVIGGSGIDITLYIWPKYFGEYEFGVDFYDEANGLWEQVEITSELKIENADSFSANHISEINELIIAHADEIERMFDLAENTLNINLQQ